MANNFFNIYGGAGFKPRSTDPSNPKNGDVFYSDGTPRAEGLWQYLAGAWVQIPTSTGTNTIVFDVVSISTNTVAVADKTYLVNTGSAVQITLPSAVANAFVRVKDSTGSANTNNITIVTPGAETIDGAASDLIDSDYGSQVYVSDGSNWFKL